LKTFAKKHTSTEQAVSWMSQILKSVERHQIVSISQSTACHSGPGIFEWWITTMVVLDESGSASKGSEK